MANVAFILADLYPDSEFIKPWQRARDAGYQTTVVGLRHGVDLERNVGADWVAGGGRGRNLITSRTPADLRPFAMHYWSSSCGAQRPATRGRRRRRTQRRTVQPQRRQCIRVITARAAAPS
jgi:putative intracellular protease/amidase